MVFSAVCPAARAHSASVPPRPAAIMPRPATAAMPALGAAALGETIGKAVGGMLASMTPATAGLGLLAAVAVAAALAIALSQVLPGTWFVIAATLLAATLGYLLEQEFGRSLAHLSHVDTCDLALARLPQTNKQLLVELLGHLGRLLLFHGASAAYVHLAAHIAARLPETAATDPVDLQLARIPADGRHR